VTDVRCATAASPCGSANSQAGADYVGEVTPRATIRLTDAFNGVTAGGGTQRATTADFPLTGSFQVPCAGTASTAVGSSCSVATTLNAVMPGAVLDGKRAVWEIGQVELLDGGADGDAATTPNSRFMVQGIFVP
jgi:hypothetical protein